MKALVELQKKLCPDLIDVMQQRYLILQTIAHLQPIGRRSLAVNTNLSERHVRGELDLLHDQGLLSVSTKGMMITSNGQHLLDTLATYMRQITDLHVLEQALQDKLHIKKVIIVPGNSDQHNWVKQEMGKACVSFLKSELTKNETIAVTGGTTMEAIGEVMQPFERVNPLFVPARGGIGEKVENQANTIAAKMANKTNGEYRQLYVPDPLSESSYQIMIKEPSIVEIVQLIRKADIILHGIGDAITMAKRRKADEQVIHKLLEKEAVSEAFGYYFNENGDVVHKVRTIGIQLEDLASSKHVITIAGGTSKAQAIVSYFKQGKSDLLVTDEGAAKEILRGNTSL
ncbi:sugar-binding transcriptional regulator [Oceanobacillus halotolerans]|uniref:sugar-binding transcriptional regulator n=1 Tax=Oceanobacillus halotolerans TaxID=2663380 RepID=UPI0013DD2839|nr:sugar-binding domain-containing protein [Oceanobacillus halotolerans]